MSKRYLTGITTTGTPHLGNYVGAIRPAIEASRHLPTNEAFYFLADYHALIKCHDPKKIAQSTLEIAATWLSLGLDPDHVVFYRQSDVPEILELSWVLNCMTAKGLMNRSHAYKAAMQQNVGEGLDPDKGVSMGLYTYPILMAADILMFNGQSIPVGKDQIQHVEMARDIAQRFNHHFSPDHAVFELPEAVVGDSAVLTGLDGRKMSKSYNNTIPLFTETDKQLQKRINKVKTNLLEPGQPKSIDDSIVFELWAAFATTDQQIYMKEQFDRGIAWGQAKKELMALISSHVGEAREEYYRLLQSPEEVEQQLQKGAHKARVEAKIRLDRVREAIGISSLKA
jgi:tryptophanyl-tRNA synthetase